MKCATVPKFKLFRELNTAQQEATLVVLIWNARSMAVHMEAYTPVTLHQQTASDLVHDS